MTISAQQLEAAFNAFDTANAKDPNQEIWEGQTFPKELIYGQRMSACLDEFAPEASPALQLAARCQHICRWEIPRSEYPMDRKGYHAWRNALKVFHGEKAGGILTDLKFPSEIIERVKFLLSKKKFKQNEESQILEDVICLVFLQYYFLPFADQHEDEKVISILQKTWRKMSATGQGAALQLTLPEKAMALITKALS